MKKVLILAYDFPPYVSVGGLRPYAWYKYLHEYEVYPIVVTRQWDNKYKNHLDYIAPSGSREIIIEESEIGTILRTPYIPNKANKIMLKYGDAKYRFFRKSISAFYEFTQWIWNIGPKSELYHSAKEYLKINKADVIIATGDPFILFKYASKLSREFNIPWIADYRDTWVQDKTGSKNSFAVPFRKILEQKYLKNSACITTVSSFIVKHLTSNIRNKEFNIILNGFDEDALMKNGAVKQESNVFTISFSGTVYKWHPWKSFLTGLSEFKKLINAEVCMIFWGVNIIGEMEEYINKNCKNIAENVLFYPKIENSKLLAELAKSNLLLLFNDYSILGTKIFDYIAVKRKIIFCYSNDSNALKLKAEHYCLDEYETESSLLQEEIILKTESGVIVNNSTHLMEVFDGLYKEFRENDYVACNSCDIRTYSRKEQTAKLASLIRSLTDKT